MLYNSAGESFGYAFEDIENNHSTTMLYGKNLQGDVTGVYDAGYGLVVEYFYDAWGNVTVECLNNSIGETLKSVDVLLYTPITYRGYMFDPFTGLYYLQSRYYNPTYGRFLNADTTEILETTQGTPLGANLFAYCNNNPVNMVDYSGMLCVGFGLFFSSALLLASSIAFMLIGDSEGNAGVFIILSIGVGAPSLSGGIALMIDSSETIFDLDGWSYTFGGSVGEGAMLGGDLIFNDTKLTGAQLSFGVTAKLPLPLEVHGLATRTILLYSWKMSSSVIANTIEGVSELLKFCGFNV